MIVLTYAILYAGDRLNAEPKVDLHTEVFMTEKAAQEGLVMSLIRQCGVDGDSVETMADFTDLLYEEEVIDDPEEFDALSWEAKVAFIIRESFGGADEGVSLTYKFTEVDPKDYL